MYRNNKTTEIINATYPSIKTNRNKIIDTVLKAITETPISIKIKQNELFLIIDEALTNAMGHGNNWNPEKYVKIKVTPKSKHVSIIIRDEGAGFNTDFINIKPESLNPGGRGIHIIKHFCNPKWNKTGNQINLKIQRQ